METAYHPGLRRFFTINEYKVEFGSRLQGDESDKRPALICYACGQPMHPVAEDMPSRAGHWSHNPSPNAPWCPLKEPSAEPYRLLAPSKEDPVAAAALRAEVLGRWRHHWGIVQQNVMMADIKTFVAFIRWADGSRLWAHRGLEAWFIPYILLATTEFPPANHPRARQARPEWFRFWFDTRVRTLDDLWIHVKDDFRLLRAVYADPKRARRPGVQHLLRIEAVHSNPSFLSAPPVRRANAYQESVVQSELGQA